jgi:hypothetical protein
MLSAMHCQAHCCFRMETEITSEIEMAKKKDKDANAVALGRKGGKARRNSLTPEQRKEIASKAAKTRWSRPRAGDQKFN